MHLRLVRQGVAVFQELSWYDLLLKTGLVALYVGIIALAVHTGSLFNNFNELYETRLGAILMTLGAGYSAFMLLITLVRVIM
ncbi:MAG TPA: hypothetical protein VHM90_14475, partial [Phycisphaerae bacterium]|nr:hypothetical protein [Phycisphaerae bacterium]